MIAASASRIRMRSSAFVLDAGGVLSPVIGNNTTVGVWLGVGVTPGVSRGGVEVIVTVPGVPVSEIGRAHV